MSYFVDESKMPELRKILVELLDLDAGLSQWEIDFLDSLNNWVGKFTENQAERLEKISERLL
jgi:hypothetical protein